MLRGSFLAIRNVYGGNNHNIFCDCIISICELYYRDEVTKLLYELGYLFELKSAGDNGQLKEYRLCTGNLNAFAHCAANAVELVVGGAGTAAVFHEHCVVACVLEAKCGLESADVGLGAEEQNVLAAVAVDECLEFGLVIGTESALFIMLIFTQRGVDGINSAAQALGVLLGDYYGNAQNAQALYQHCGSVQNSLCFIDRGHQFFLKVDAYCDSVFGSESHDDYPFGL